MRVHFGGSLKKFRQYPDMYLEISNTIKGLGHELVRDWIQEEIEGITAPMDMLYEYTVNSIKNSDAVILENSLSSTSVGQQLMICLQHNVPVLLLRSTKISTSNNKEGIFVSKNLEKLVTRKRYNSRNLRSTLSDFLDNKASEFSVSRFNLVLEKNLDKYLKSLARKNNSSKAAELRKLVVEKMLSENL